MTTSNPATVTRTSQLTAALVCSGVATLALTALAAIAVFGGLLGLQSSAPTDRGIGTAFLLFAIAVLAPPVVLMWIALVRLTTQPPRGARLMIGCLRAVGGFVLVVALPTLSRSGSVAVIGAAIGIGLVFIAVAQMLASATRS